MSESDPKDPKGKITEEPLEETGQDESAQGDSDAGDDPGISGVYENMPDAVPVTAEGESPSSGGDSTEDSPGGSPDDSEDGDDELDEMPLTSHLNELRQRVVRCVIAIGIVFVPCYMVSEELFRILMDPMQAALNETGGNFIYTYAPEAFIAYVKVAFLASVLIASPFIFYQLWQFIAPGLYKHEQKILIPLSFFTAMFFVVGSLFGYFGVLPVAYKFLAGFSIDGYIAFTPKMSENLGMAIKLLLAFGFVFEMPIFVFFLARMGLVTAAGMRKWRKYAIVCSFIIAAVLTPPDPASQALMAGPLLILYELSVWVAKLFGKKRPGEEQAGDEDEAVTQDATGTETPDSKAE